MIGLLHTLQKRTVDLVNLIVYSEAEVQLEAVLALDVVINLVELQRKCN